MAARHVAGLLALALCAPFALPVEPDDVAARLEAALEGKIAPGEPGGAVLVVKGGRPLLRKAVGLANLELAVPNTPDTVFRIGSVTKQFTAVAVLLLVQDGKLRLEDEVSKHLPEADVQGRKVTVEHLLTHTSGMASYTEQPEFLTRMREDQSAAQILARTKGLPFAFEPGTKYAYNNTGYILLGALVERLSGLSWEDFVRTRITEPLGLKSTTYDHTERIVARRAAGYEHDATGWRNTPYLSMTQPYAAGALLSTVDDLAAWDAALRSGKVVRKDLLDRAWSSFRLADGSPAGYGYGWLVAAVEGHRTVQHGGGINGFSSYVLSAPDDDLFVAVLMNRTNGPTPGSIASALFAIAAGIERPRKVAVALPPAVLDRYPGRYQLAPGFEIAITREGDQLMAQATGQPRFPIFAEREDEFFLEVVPASISFVVEEGKATRLTLHQGGRDMPGPRVGDVVELKLVELDTAALDALAGTYELAPGFVLEVRRDGKRLLGRATNQPAFELRPVSGTRFVVPEVGAEIEFGKEGLVLHQGGAATPGKRVR